MKSGWLAPLTIATRDFSRITTYTGRARGDARIWQYVIQDLVYDEHKPDVRSYLFAVYAERGDTYRLVYGWIPCDKHQIAAVTRIVLGTRVGDLTHKDLDNARMEGLL